MSFIIYGKEMCDWCDKAKELCHQYGLNYEYRAVDDRFDGEANLADLREKASAESITIKTVPAIWHNGKFIGGFDELGTYIENTREFGQGGF